MIGLEIFELWWKVYRKFICVPGLSFWAQDGYQLSYLVTDIQSEKQGQT